MVFIELFNIYVLRVYTTLIVNFLYMKTFAIESSCDDTSLALVEYQDNMIQCTKLLTHRQEFHSSFGGVVPELASRAHSKDIVSLFQQFLEEEGTTIHDFFETIDCISVTEKPWLSGSLMVWKTFARMLSLWYKKPLYYLDHCYGHVFSLLLDRPLDEIVLPMVVLSASGWHTNLYLITHKSVTDVLVEIADTIGSYCIQWISSTRDDSAGEAFDKVARLLGWPYPWGRRIEEQASQYAPASNTWPYVFKRVLLEKGTLDFSFSGMKSQALQFVNEYQNKNKDDILPVDVVQEIAYEFQEAMIDILSQKLSLAQEFTQAHTLWVVWGVSANKRFHQVLQQTLTVPYLTLKKMVYCTDNAAMIGCLWILEHLSNQDVS